MLTRTRLLKQAQACDVAAEHWNKWQEKRAQSEVTRFRELAEHYRELASKAPVKIVMFFEDGTEKTVE